MNNRRSLFTSLYKVHVYAGLFIALHVAIFSVTGFVLLFEDEILGERPTVLESAVDSQTATVQMFEGARALAEGKYAGERPLAIFPDEDHEGLLHLRLGQGDSNKLRGARRLVFDVAAGREVEPGQGISTGFFDFILRLHREFLLGSNGKLYIGLVGLVYVFMLGSGFFLYGKFMKGRRLGSVRAAFVPKLVDLHKFVGVVTFGWALMVGITGVLLAFNGVLIKLFLAQSLEHLSKQYEGFAGGGREQAAFTEVLQTAVTAKPDTIITYVSFPDTEFGIPGHFLFLVNGREGVSERISDLVVVNAQTANLAEIVELPMYLKAVLVSEPLHFGDYGGLPLKIIWGLFTLCSLAVAGFGVWSFYVKRRKKKPGTKTERAPVKTTEAPVKRPSEKHPYRIPVTLAVLSVIGMGVSLFVGETVGRVASVLLALPLIVLVVRSRSHG